MGAIFFTEKKNHWMKNGKTCNRKLVGWGLQDNRIQVVEAGKVDLLEDREVGQGGWH